MFCSFFGVQSMCTKCYFMFFGRGYNNIFSRKNIDWNITKFLLQWETENWEKKPIKQSDWIVVQCTGTLVLHVVQCTGTL